MRILWITNIKLPPLCEQLQLPVPSIGGWMYSSLKRLVVNSQDSYGVATIWEGKELKEYNINNVTYYLLPLNGKISTEYNNHLEKYWRMIKASFKPDIIHIHGTEYPHGLAYVNSCGSNGVVVSIQGIISCIAKYYTAGITNARIKKNITLRDILKGGIISQQKSFERRRKSEIQLIKSVNHIIGRTEWDRAHIWALNPFVNYYHVGETLRDSFYGKKWRYGLCEPHSIFISQASYPIKGFHKLLEALPLVLKCFPDTKVYVAGADIHNQPWYRIGTYANYIKHMILKWNLNDVVKFVGNLNEEQMSQQYLKSNLFICCSAIENSPNSLGEAQVLGVPHLASFVGGIPEIVNYNSNVLYRFEETEMLAKKICDIFGKGDNIDIPTYDMNMYDGNSNLEALRIVYKQIYKD